MVLIIILMCYLLKGSTQNERKLIVMMLVPRRNMDLFDDFFDDSFFKKNESVEHPMMKTDVRELDNSYIIDVDLPGVEKENIKIDVEDGYLNINAKVETSNNEENNGTFIRQERFVGECSRSFYIGEEIKDEDIKASFKNGILSLSFPKVESKREKPEKKYIEIN